MTVDTAWQYLVSQPGVNGDVTGLGGAGVLGVDNAVLTARRHSTEVKSLVLLSGETFLPGQQFLRQASQLPGLFVVADDDEGLPTEEVMEWIYGVSSNPGKRLVHYAGKKAPWNGFEDTGIPAVGTHGTDLFKTHPELPGIIVDWFVTTLITTPGHAPSAAFGIRVNPQSTRSPRRSSSGHKATGRGAAQRSQGAIVPRGCGHHPRLRPYGRGRDQVRSRDHEACRHCLSGLGRRIR